MVIVASATSFRRWKPASKPPQPPPMIKKSGFIVYFLFSSLITNSDTVGKPVALAAQRLRRFAEVFFCGGRVGGPRPPTRPPQKRTNEPRSGEQSPKGGCQRYQILFMGSNGTCACMD